MMPCAQCAASGLVLPSAVPTTVARAPPGGSSGGSSSSGGDGGGSSGGGGDDGPNEGPWCPRVHFKNGRNELIEPLAFTEEVYMLGTCTRTQVPLKLAWVSATTFQAISLRCILPQR